MSCEASCPLVFTSFLLVPGPPDVDQPCEPSLQAWSPELHLYDMNMTVPCPQPDGCILELRFLHPVYPDSLTLWTTYLSTGSPKALSDIEILTEQGGVHPPGPPGHLL